MNIPLSTSSDDQSVANTFNKISAVHDIILAKSKVVGGHTFVPWFFSQKREALNDVKKAVTEFQKLVDSLSQMKVDVPTIEVIDSYLNDVNQSLESLGPNKDQSGWDRMKETIVTIFGKIFGEYSTSMSVNADKLHITKRIMDVAVNELARPFNAVEVVEGSSRNDISGIVLALKDENKKALDGCWRIHRLEPPKISLSIWPTKWMENLYSVGSGFMPNMRGYISGTLHYFNKFPTQNFTESFVLEKAEYDTSKQNIVLKKYQIVPDGSDAVYIAPLEESNELPRTIKYNDFYKEYDPGKVIDNKIKNIFKKEEISNNPERKLLLETKQTMRSEFDRIVKMINERGGGATWKVSGGLVEKSFNNSIDDSYTMQALAVNMRFYRDKAADYKSWVTGGDEILKVLQESCSKHFPETDYPAWDPKLTGEENATPKELRKN